MIWRFSDGTEVTLGGTVAGATVLARRLREQLADGSATARVWPPPGGEVQVDPTDAAIVDRWLQDELDFWVRCRGLELTLERPDDVPPLPAPPWAGKPLEEGMLY